VPQYKKTGEIEQDLKNRADSIKSLQIKARLHLHDKTRRYPSFNCSIWFFSREDELFLRIRGLGPFGLSVFDLLADKTRVWIYLPDKGRVLKGNTFFTSYGNIDVKTAIRLMEICLNPWSPIRFCQILGIHKGNRGTSRIVSLHGRFLGQDLNLNYVLPSLAPLRFDSPIISITFKQKQWDRTIYPQEISFLLWKEGIGGRLVIKDVRFNSLSPKNRVFDSSLFNSRP